MPSAERTLTIAAPLEKVFAFFTTPENDLTWRQELVEATAEGPMGLNTVIRQVVQAPAVGKVAADAVDIRGPQKLLFNKPTQASMNATVAALDKVKALLEG